mmetsp:Transcript_47945/g.138768  ORF Transcript_47945/g.138768 Transcript_47945/m.138768 type:complete len:150 (+) Transcript_47945:213-662(+)
MSGEVTIVAPRGTSSQHLHGHPAVKPQWLCSPMVRCFSWLGDQLMGAWEMLGEAMTVASPGGSSKRRHGQHVGKLVQLPCMMAVCSCLLERVTGMERAFNPAVERPTVLAWLMSGVVTMAVKHGSNSPLRLGLHAVKPLLVCLPMDQSS